MFVFLFDLDTVSRLCTFCAYVVCMQLIRFVTRIACLRVCSSDSLASLAMVGVCSSFVGFRLIRAFSADLRLMARGWTSSNLCTAPLSSLDSQEFTVTL